MLSGEGASEGWRPFDSADKSIFMVTEKRDESGSVRSATFVIVKTQLPFNTYPCISGTGNVIGKSLSLSTHLPPIFMVQAPQGSPVPHVYHHVRLQVHDTSPQPGESIVRGQGVRVGIPNHQYIERVSFPLCSSFDERQFPS